MSTLTEIREVIHKEMLQNQEFMTTDEAVLESIDQKIMYHKRDQYISLNDRLYLNNVVFNRIRRLDVLQPLIDDDEISEIMINGIESAFIEKNGEVTPVVLEGLTIEKLEDLIQKIVGKVNRVVNEKTPICDARLEDGSRINVVLPPLALNGPILTIRKFPQKPLNMEALIQNGSINEAASEFLKHAVEAKYNIFISGGTGTGKTTFLNVLSQFIQEKERVITIEDSAELQIRQLKNLVRLETRNENITGTGKISIKDLIRTALRMRPDRIVVGEVRGEEALDMLQAMNTGHDGSLSTGHANSAKDMLNRLETMILSACNMPEAAIRQQIFSGIEFVVHLERMNDGSRKVVEISELSGVDQQNFVLTPIFQWTNHELIRTDEKITRMQKFERVGLEW